MNIDAFVICGGTRYYAGAGSGWVGDLHAALTYSWAHEAEQAVRDFPAVHQIPPEKILIMPVLIDEEGRTRLMPEAQHV